MDGGGGGGCNEGDGFKSHVLTWTRNAAEQGDAVAQFNLAVLLDAGNELARERLDSDLWRSLAGQQIAQDKAQAARYYRMAAEQGHAGACTSRMCTCTYIPMYNALEPEAVC